MQTHRRKKVEIVVEAAFVRPVLDWLKEMGATGYTLIPKVSGDGHHGERAAGDISRVFDNVLIIAIVREEVAYRILEDSLKVLANATGIVYLSDVEVARAGHF